MLSKEENGVRVAAAFEHQHENALGVRVEIANDTPAPFEVSPGDITFMTCPTIDNASCDGSFSVVDPEAMLSALDENQSRVASNASNARAFWGTLAFLSAVGDVASVANGHTRHVGEGTVAALGAGAASEANAENEQSAIDTERELWSNAALRRSTIAPGAGVAGLIFIPIDTRAQFIWVHVRAGGHVFPFGFHQTVRTIDPVNGSTGAYNGRS
ncbi:MAG TPA: hypothetical protein VHJ20_00400 [Polyangia bacterium]|nr:hypothetical protein [Polyangia bacterium]